MDPEPESVDVLFPDLVWRGIALLNNQEYFEAHEVLETAWRAEKKPIRTLYQGILQAGIAYYHLRRGNRTGTLKLLNRAILHLSPWENMTSPVNVTDFLHNLQIMREYLQKENEKERYQEYFLRPLEITRK